MHWTHQDSVSLDVLLAAIARIPTISYAIFIIPIYVIALVDMK